MTLRSIKHQFQKKNGMVQKIRLNTLSDKIIMMLLDRYA